MQKIIVSAADVWDYFQKNRVSIIDKEHIIAENEEFGVVISLTSELGLPCFIVTADDYQYAEERAISKEDCRVVVSKLYDYYLTEAFLSGEEDTSDDDDSLLDQEDIISEREEELDEAVIYLISTIVGDDMDKVFKDNSDDVCEDVKDHIIEYLYRKHGVSPRRPMILEDEETHEDFFEEYPYDCMVFDDEDNPIYKK